MLKISIIIPTKNRCNSLKRTIDNFLVIDYPNFEIIVIDGASTDKTVDLLRSYNKKIIKWISEPDKNPAIACNKGLRMSSGEIIVLAPDDDKLINTSFEYAANYFDQNPNVDILFGKTLFYKQNDDKRILIDNSKSFDSTGLNIHNYLRNRFKLGSGAAFIRKSVFDKIGLYNTKYLCNDTDFFARALSQNIIFGSVSVVFWEFNMNNNSVIRNNKWRVKFELLKITLKFGNILDVFFMLNELYVKMFSYRNLSNRIFGRVI